MRCAPRLVWLYCKDRLLYFFCLLNYNLHWFCKVVIFALSAAHRFSFHSRIFHSNADVTIAGKWLQIFTYARHSWPLSSEVSLACHTYCDTVHSFIMVISEDPWHSHLMPLVWQWICLYLILMWLVYQNQRFKWALCPFSVFLIVVIVVVVAN